MDNIERTKFVKSGTKQTVTVVVAHRFCLEHLSDADEWL